MPIFKGKKDEGRVQQAAGVLAAGKVAKGIGGQVQIDGDWISINRKGLAAKATHGLAGEKRVPIANVTAVRLKEPGLTNGYITFSVLGNVDHGRGVYDATRDENTVMFSKGHLAEF